MSHSIRADFSSCLSGGAGDVFSKTKRGFGRFWLHIEKFFAKDGPNTILKTTDPILELISIIAQKNGAPKEDIEGINNVRAGIKTARDAFGLFNVFKGAISRLISEFKTFGLLCVSIFETGEEVRFSKRAEEFMGTIPADQDGKTYTAERVLAAGNYFGKLVADGAYIVAFGGMRPLNFAYENIRDGEGNHLVHLDEETLRFVKSFPTVIAVCQFANLFSYSCEFGYLHYAYRRAKNEGLPNVGNLAKDRRRRIVQLGLSGVEKLIDFSLNIIRHTGQHLSPFVSLPLTIVSCGISCYSLWLKTA